MKQYIQPQLLILSIVNEDIITLSEQSSGKGDLVSFSDLIFL